MRKQFADSSSSTAEIKRVIHELQRPHCTARCTASHPYVTASEGNLSRSAGQMLSNQVKLTVFMGKLQ